MTTDHCATCDRPTLDSSCDRDRLCRCNRRLTVTRIDCGDYWECSDGERVWVQAQPECKPFNMEVL